MVKVTVTKQSNFAVNAKKIKQKVAKTVTNNGVVSDSEVSVAIAGEAKLTELAMAYLGESEEEAKDHPVLSFPTSEIQGAFVFPPDGVIHLGEVIVSYPRAVEEAKSTNRLIDDVISDLAVHGTLHLLGIHHD